MMAGEENKSGSTTQDSLRKKISEALDTQYLYWAPANHSTMLQQI